MTFLPIVERELRVAARKGGTFWMRFSAALAAIAIGVWIFLIMVSNVQSTSAGPTLLYGLSTVLFIYCVSVGLVRTADCLSEEKREGTLGLLFLTDLKGYDIVLGKLAATSLNAIYGMVAIFPVLAVPLLAGGVTGREFTRVLLSSAATLFFSLSLGMFCSGICREDRKSVVLTLVFLLVFCIGIPWLTSALEQLPHHKFFPYTFYIFSPSFLCVSSFEVQFKGLPAQNLYYISLAIIFGLSWLLLAITCFVVPRTWQDKTVSSEKLLRIARWRRNGFLGLANASTFRAHLLHLNPIYWLSSRNRLKPLSLWLFIGLGMIIWGCGLLADPRNWKDPSLQFTSAIICGLILKCWVALEAARLLSVERKNGALELLLCTPLQVRDILAGHLRALTRLFLGPVLVVFAGDIIFLLISRSDRSSLLVWVLGTLIYLLDIAVLAVLALWLGLIGRSPVRAAAAAITRVLVLPWMIFSVLMTFEALAGSPLEKLVPSRLAEFSGTLIWFLISLAIALFFGLSALRHLRRDFRTVAAHQFQSRRAQKQLRASQPTSVASAVALPNG